MHLTVQNQFPVDLLKAASAADALAIAGDMMGPSSRSRRIPLGPYSCNIFLLLQLPQLITGQGQLSRFIAHFSEWHCSLIAMVLRSDLFFSSSGEGRGNGSPETPCTPKGCIPPRGR